MGDGKLLESIARNDASSLCLGIEVKSELCDQARSRIVFGNNVLIVNGSFEEVILNFPDASVDHFICVLPDPAYIDKRNQEKWAPFYKIVRAKLKDNGILQLVTEITDELLRPVSDSAYSKWAGWLHTTFSSMGFLILNEYEGVPDGYFSNYLDQFRGDRQRIRIMTLEMSKH